MSEKLLKIKELVTEIGGFVSADRLRIELSRAEYTPYITDSAHFKFKWSPESRKFLYDNLLNRKGIRKRFDEMVVDDAD